MMAPIDKAKQAVRAIIDDLTDRKGLRQEWEAIDEDTQTEIREAWETIIFDEFFVEAVDLSP